ncbi:MAG: hypothetical protein JO345_34895 [Streptosporangiaceae bacterium]|nr:hypothetical protein [Streptosporangiaceae bacterium]
MARSATAAGGAGRLGGDVDAEGLKAGEGDLLGAVEDDLDRGAADEA